MRGRERRTIWLKTYYSNTRKNLPPSVKCSASLSAAILIPFSNSANPRQACLPILPRLNILKVLPISFPNSKLREKSVRKRKADSKYSLIRKLSTGKRSKPTVISAVEYRECLPRPVLRFKRKLITNNFQIFIRTFFFINNKGLLQMQKTHL